MLEEQAGGQAVVITGGFVVDVVNEVVRPADVLIDGPTISDVAEPGTLSRPGARVVDAGGGLVLPGFVNAHTHSYSMLCRHVGPGLPLEPWMMHAWAYTIGRTTDEVRLSALLHAVEALRTGTTTLLDHLGGSVANCEAALEAYDEIGLRAIVAPMVSDVPLPDTVGLAPSDWPADSMRDAEELRPPDGALDATLELHDRWRPRSGRVRVFLGPSAPSRCSQAMLERCAQLSADLGLGVHTHLLETRPQANMVPPHGYRSWVAYLDSVGLLSERLSTAHVVWPTSAELELLAERQVTLVHNPWSNLTLGSGVADLPAWRRAGVRAALGTDGVNCGGSMDMVAAMRLATELHRPAQGDPSSWETPWSALKLAASGANCAFGLQGGALEKGMPADLSIFDTRGTEYCTHEDLLASLVLSSYDHSARMVVVDGRVVVDEGRVTSVDEEALIEETREVFRHLRDSNGRYVVIAEAQQQTLTRLAASTPANRPVMSFRRSGPEA